ncbi:MAG: CHRD domain-containing protein [Balneolaceae bacterium]
MCLFFGGFSSIINAQTVFEAQLSGSNEVGPLTTLATGEVTATLNGMELTVEGTFDSLGSDLNTDIQNGAHIHSGMAGENGPILFELEATVNGDNRSGSFETANNTFELTSGQVDTLMSRGLYVNIHSMNYEGGEIRGQLLPESEAYFRANISSAFEVPAIKTRGSGAAVLELREDTLYVSGSFSGLSDTYTASHIHTALTGSNGGVTFELTPSLGDDETSGVYIAEENKFELNSEESTSLWNREFYINVHTSTNPGGEIRGQITPPVTAAFFASLSGSAENPSLDVSGSGGLTIELFEDSLFASGSFSGLESDYTDSHIHTGHTGTNGGVLFGLTVETEDNITGSYSSSDNRFELSAEERDLLLLRGMYANVHTSDNPGGELRGQVSGEATSYFRTNMNGHHENDPILETSAFGGVDIEISGTRAVVSGSFNQLSDEYSGSHIHEATVSANGDVEVPLEPSVTGDTAGVFEANFYILTESQLDALYDENMYVNVHSSSNPGGEIRGQLLFGDNSFPTPAEITTPDDDHELIIEGDGSSTLSVSWSDASDADENELRYVWMLSTNADFENEDIVLLVNAESETEAEVTFEVLDDMLSELEISLDASTTLYHRVAATDGSNESYSEPRSMEMTRGMDTSSEEENGEKPYIFGLDQNYPNPFNPTTNITFTLSEPGQVNVAVYNMLGQEVAVLTNKRYTAGQHHIEFDAERLTSGVYVYRLKAEGKTLNKRMTLIK